jgi:hypothetical protein
LPWYYEVLKTTKGEGAVIESKGGSTSAFLESKKIGKREGERGGKSECGSEGE